MDNTAVVVVVSYLVIVTLIGTLLARRNAGAGDWAVAGGGMGVMMIAVGVAGTRIGGAGTYGVAGDVMTDGVWNMWWYGIASFLAMLVMAVLFVKPYRRLQLHTVGEIFTRRFGDRRNQVLTSLCVQIEYFIVNVIEAYVIAVVLKGIVGMPMHWGVLVAASVLVTYVALGGLWGAAFANLIHCVVIIAGLGAVAWMGVDQLGGWAATRELVDAAILTQQLAHPDGLARADRFWTLTGGSWIPVIAMIFSVVIHTPAASVYTNYASAARTERTLVPAFLIAGLIAALMPVLAGIVGLLSLAHYGFESGVAGYANLTRVAADVSPVVGALAIAAVLAAVISSGGPILLASATMFVRDWLPGTSEWSTTRQLRAYRVTTVVYGLVAAGIAWLNAVVLKLSVLDMLLFGFAMVVPPAICVTFLLYWRRTTSTGVFVGMAAGLAAGLACFAWVKATGSGLDPSYATTLVPLVVVPLVSLLTDDSAGQQARADGFYGSLRAAD
ncbi:MAG TPA: hypothetical protein VLA56_01100 [Pseudomonadales bacterium]|nr:hypothetical protein [Pseudomonadales bacterium]